MIEPETRKDRDGDDYQVIALTKYYTGCSYCQDEREVGNTMFPPHKPASCCESGRRPHCTCDRCF